MAGPNDYCLQSDLYKYGLPRGMLANPGRLCATVLAATDTFELDGHGFFLNDPLITRIEAGGAMPAPLVAGVTVFAIPQNETSFKVSATAGGAAIDLTTDGLAVVVATPLPFDEVIDFYSRFVDGVIPAHFVPLTTTGPAAVPTVPRATVAELAAKKLLMLCGQTSETMKELELAAKAQLERWAQGYPLRDARATGPADLAVSESIDSLRGGTLP